MRYELGLFATVLVRRCNLGSIECSIEIYMTFTHCDDNDDNDNDNDDNKDWSAP